MFQSLFQNFISSLQIPNGAIVSSKHPSTFFSTNTAEWWDFSFFLRMGIPSKYEQALNM